MKKESCPFCGAGERIIEENEHAYVMLSNPRLTPGHLLVIPKRHVEKPWELTDEEVKAIFELVRKYQKKVVEKISEGVGVRQHYRPFVKQGRVKVDHTHYHIIPREFEDKIYKNTQTHEIDLFKDLGAEERGKIEKKFAE